MAGNKAAIKSRIKSINATKKITGAMELIASVKLTKSRNTMLANKTYANSLKDIVSCMLDSEIDIENELLNEKNAKERLFFIFSSDMGLCGGYNINLAKFISEQVEKTDYLYVIGTKLYTLLKRNDYRILNNELPSDGVDYTDIKELAVDAIDMFKANKIKSINIIYTEFINNVNFKPTLDKVLPCKLENDSKKYKQILFEPSPQSILDDLIPMVAIDQIYTRYLEAKTSEHGNRRFAMENATDNANELTDELLLAYNQARQAAITSEITEIVAGADAL